MMRCAWAIRHVTLDDPGLRHVSLDSPGHAIRYINATSDERDDAIGLNRLTDPLESNHEPR
jgi:hypothetical protein